jgi:hypothetical protein
MKSQPTQVPFMTVSKEPLASSPRLSSLTSTSPIIAVVPNTTGKPAIAVSIEIAVKPKTVIEPDIADVPIIAVEPVIAVKTEIAITPQIVTEPDIAIDAGITLEPGNAVIPNHHR